MTSSETLLGLRSSCGLVEILQQLLEAAVAVLGLAEIGLAVEVDVAEDAFQLGLVLLFDGVQGDVDQLADIGRVALFVEAVVIGQEPVLHLARLMVLQLGIGEDEALALQPAADARVVVAVLLAVLFEVVVPEVGDVFQEQHHQDVVLVLRRIDNAPEGVACGPRRVVDVLLVDLSVHLLYSLSQAG